MMFGAIQERWMMRADTVHLNGKVWSGQRLGGEHHVEGLTALATAERRVVLCGTDDEVRDMFGNDMVTIALAGRRVDGSCRA
jgi:predicted amidohydrolase YtcJ